MRDYLLEKICDLEKWIESDGKKWSNFPLVAMAYLLLFFVLMVSNLFATIGLVGSWFVKQKKFEPQVVELENSDQLKEIIAESNFVLVDFWAAWCGPCMMMKPALKAVAAKFAGSLVVVMIDSSQFGELSKEYSVAGLPSLLFFKNGELVDRHAGALSEQHLSDLIADKLMQIET